MRISPSVPFALALALVLIAPGCSSKIAPGQIWSDTVSALPVVGGDSSLQTHSVRLIKSVVMRRVAVMPFIDHPNATGEKIEDDAADALTAVVYSRMSLVSGWDVVPESDVQPVMDQLPPTTLSNLKENARKLGRQVSADAVLCGTVTRYKERVGEDYAAQSPAAVAFEMRLIDVHNGVVLWTARYAKQQTSLSQNIFDLPAFLNNRGRWVRASDIAQHGVDEAVNNLRDKLNFVPAAKPIANSSGQGPQ